MHDKAGCASRRRQPAAASTLRGHPGHVRATVQGSTDMNKMYYGDHCIPTSVGICNQYLKNTEVSYPNRPQLQDLHQNVRVPLQKCLFVVTVML